MATAKKKAAPRKAAAPKTAKAQVQTAAAKGGKGGKGLLIAGALFAALALLGLQIVTMARRQAALKFDMLRNGKNIVQGMADGQGLSPQSLQGDKDDNLFYQEGMGPDLPRLQKFDPQGDFVAAYKPKKASEMLTGAVDIDVDEEGGPWVLLRSGEIRVLDKNLKFVKTIATRVGGPSGIGLSPDGRVFVASQNENKVVVFTREGQRSGEFGAPGTKSGDITSPVRMRVTVDGLIAVMEQGSSGLHMKVFGPDLKLKTQFDLAKVPWCEPVKLGVTADGKMFVNDQLGGRGLVIYDLKSGDFLGESKGTTDGQLFISPGSSGANKYGSTVYVHSINGLTRCHMPEGKKK